MKTAFGHLATWAFWLLLAIPGWPVIRDFWYRDWHYPELMHISGEWCIQFLVATLLVTPAIHLIKPLPFGPRAGRLLIKARRHLGVASFGYALLHVLLYVRDVWDILLIYLEAFDLELAVAWISFILFTVLAITSNQTSVRKLGIRWKRLHYMVYPCAAFAFWHWYLFDDLLSRVLTWLLPLVIIRGAFWGWQKWRVHRAVRDHEASLAA